MPPGTALPSEIAPGRAGGWIYSLMTQYRLLSHALIAAIGLPKNADCAENLETDQRPHGLSGTHAGYDARAVTINLLAVGIGLKPC